MTDEEQHSSWQKYCQTVAGQGPADDEICEQPRPTFSIHLTVVHFSKVVFSNVTAASVNNFYRSQLNVVAQNFLVNVATLCVKWIPFIFKITNIICCPTPILREIIFGSLQKQALRTRSCVLRIFLKPHKQLGSCQVAVRQLLGSN